VYKACKMSRKLIIGMTYTLVEPSKLGLISLSNLLWNSPQAKHENIYYTIIEGSKQISRYVIYEHRQNLNVLNHLSSIDCTDPSVNIDTMLKRYTNEQIPTIKYSS